MRNLSLRRVQTVLITLAAIAYNNWLFGFILNPTVARYGLASDLEASGQPYRFLFIGMDIVSGLLLLVAVSLRITHTHSPLRTLRLVQAGWTVFGLATIIDALLPLHCLPASLGTCGLQDDLYGSHDILGYISILGVGISLISLGWHIKRTKPLRRKQLTTSLVGLSTLWAGSGLIYSLSALDGRSDSPLLQQLFLLLTGACLAYSAALAETFVIAPTRRE